MCCVHRPERCLHTCKCTHTLHNTIKYAQNNNKYLFLQWGNTNRRWVSCLQLFRLKKKKLHRKLTATHRHQVIATSRHIYQFNTPQADPCKVKLKPIPSYILLSYFRSNVHDIRSHIQHAYIVIHQHYRDNLQLHVDIDTYAYHKFM